MDLHGPIAGEMLRSQFPSFNASAIEPSNEDENEGLYNKFQKRETAKSI